MSAAVPFQPDPRRCDNSGHFDRRQPLRAACLCHQSPEPGRRRPPRVICPASLARSRCRQAEVDLAGRVRPEAPLGDDSLGANAFLCPSQFLSNDEPTQEQPPTTSRGADEADEAVGGGVAGSTWSQFNLPPCHQVRAKNKQPKNRLTPHTQSLSHSLSHFTSVQPANQPTH